MKRSKDPQGEAPLLDLVHGVNFLVPLSVAPRIDTKYPQNEVASLNSCGVYYLIFVRKERKDFAVIAGK